MHLDRTRIAIRRRSLMEVFDLALWLCRANVRPILLVFLLICIPLAALNYYLLSGFPASTMTETLPHGYLLWLTVLMLIQSPLATAPLTVYVSKRVFTEQPRWNEVLLLILRRLPQLLWYRVVLMPLLMNYPFIVEIVLLEQTPYRSKNVRQYTTWRRIHRLHRLQHGEFLGYRIIMLLLGAMVVVALMGSLITTQWFLTGRAEISPIYWTIYYPITLWIVLLFFTVARFLSYLDLRIRREGWDVDLAIRATREEISQWKT